VTDLALSTRRFGRALAVLAVVAFASAVGARAETADPVPVPPHLGDAGLAAAAERYRALQARGGWTAIPDGPTLKIGDTSPRVERLRRRLAEEGYLAGDAAAAAGTPSRYDAGLAGAVIAFQRRNGLEPDAAVGRATLRALNVTVAQRLAQIELNRVRLRTLAEGLERRYVVINIADQRLEAVADDAVALSARVIVGKPTTRTPVFASRIDTVMFNPPWNVPVSIARNEILPRLRRDPGYLDRENMIILDRPDDPYGHAIDWRTVALGPFVNRLRQLPGDKNALGRVMFDFPNAYSVYLHDTPVKQLFERSPRLFSHGCMRLQNPLALARYLLSAQGWDDARMQAAIDAGSTLRVALVQHMPIVVTYLTAFADTEGAVQFRDDAYGWDAAGRTFAEEMRPGAAPEKVAACAG
jgi:murein L,D-transpeptidase YcbB/YkuD